MSSAVDTTALQPAAASDEARALFGQSAAAAVDRAPAGVRG
jgi:hypothetical protein